MVHEQGARIGDVTLVKDCMICHREVIMMATRDQKNKLPEKDSMLPSVCKKCHEKYLTEGILLINPDTGRLVVLKESAFVQIFSKVDIKKALEMRICFTDDEILDKIYPMTGRKNE